MIGLLAKLLSLPVTAPTNALMSVLRAIRDEVDKEHQNPDSLRRQLVELQALLEAGEIDEATYDELEEDLLDALERLHLASAEDEQ